MAKLFGTTLGQVLRRAFRLMRRPWVLLVFFLVAGGVSSLVVFPVFALPGYELAAAVTLALGLLGPVVGVSAARLERRLMLEADASMPIGDSGSVMLPFLASVFVCTCMAWIPWGAATVRALTSTACSPFAHAAFFPLLAVPTIWVSCATGIFCGFLTARAKGAAGCVVVVLLMSAVSTCWPLVFGPQVFAFNHFGGYLPGPLYDEALELRPSLLWFRLETVLWAVCLLALSIFTFDARLAILGRLRFRPGALLFLLMGAAGIYVLESHATTLGFRMSAQALQEELGAKRVTDHLVIYYPRGKNREDVERLVRDLEFRYAQLAGFLGGGPKERIRVYVHKSEAEKARRVGAAQTQFAKPWRLELHLNDAAFPNPTAKHELAHVVAAPFGSGPFRVTSRLGGVWPVIGIIEGFAVAADNPMDQLTLHEWVAAMRREKLAPNVRLLLKPQGFYASAAARAYTVVGSFIRYLADTHGTQKLRALYAHGDFEDAYGAPLETLADEWERHLDALPLDASVVSQAFARFRQGSLFARPCAREVATLKERAAAFLGTDPEEAERIFTRCSQLQPEEPSHHIGRAQALLRQNRLQEALDLLKAWEKKAQAQSQLLADTLMTQADVTWRMGRPQATRELLTKVLVLKPSPSLDRTAHVKLIATDGSPASAAIWGYFQPAVEELKLLQLREAAALDPEHPYLNYLLGRRLAQANAPHLATAYLVRALSHELPESVKKESLRLLLQAEFESGDCNAVSQTVGSLPGFGTAFVAWAREWKERCEFEKKHFPSLLSPQEPFR